MDTDSAAGLVSLGRFMPGIATLPSIVMGSRLGGQIET
jgi:hypothetical protein